MNERPTFGMSIFSLIGILSLTIALTACATNNDVDPGGAPPEPTPAPSAPTPEVGEVPTVPVEPPTTDDEALEEPTPTIIDEPTEVETPESGALVRLKSVDIALEFVADGFIQPTALVPATDGTDRLFVLSRTGVIHVLEHGHVREEPFLDIQEQVTFEMVEQGMLSIALHPDFQNNGYFYVNYIDSDENTMISRFQASEDGQRAIRESETPILSIEQPHYSHNGGNLKFGPDGYLYIGLGDGEDPGDPNENAQDASSLLGALLRIDVDVADPYGIPPDNPFVGNDELRDEVWAFGLRNPWRYSFHPITGDLYLVDVGQWSVEEINVQPADSAGGENYGWPIMEGDECWEADECETAGLTMPVATYTNPDGGCAVIGGYSYYGEKHPELEDIYFFGDWCTGNIWGLLEDNGEWVYELLLETELMINAFGVDQSGEIYVLDFESGGVYRITTYSPPG